MTRRLTNAAVPILAGLLCVALHLATARIGYSIGDEGYLLLDTLKTLHGFTPVVDMQSYDPGRYYWSAAWMRLLGSADLTGLRISIGLLLGVALAATTWAQRDALGVRASVLPWIGILLLWMAPRHKAYEVAISLLAVTVGYALLVSGSRRVFAAGAFVGLAALFGRNHGLYTGLQIGILLLVTCRLHAVPATRAVAVFAAGVVVGYAPEWLLLVFKAGFFDKFDHLNRVLLAHGSTNLGLPVPWPWLVDWSGAFSIQSLFRFSTGLGFLLIPFVVVVSGVSLVAKFARNAFSPRGTATAPTVATAADLLLLSAAVAAPLYGYHAFSRADLPHLTQGIGPTLVAASCLIHQQWSTRWRRLGVGMGVGLVAWLSIASLAAVSIQPAFAWAWLGSAAFVPVVIGGETIMVGNPDANVITRVTDSLRAANPSGPQPKVFVAPHWPGLYPVLGQDCPTYNSYFIFPETAEVQQQMIVEMEVAAVSHAVLADTTIDGRDDSRFASTHPLLMRHIENHYTRLPRRDPQFSIWARTATPHDTAAAGAVPAAGTR